MNAKENKIRRMRGRGRVGSKRKKICKRKIKRIKKELSQQAKEKKNKLKNIKITASEIP